MITFKEFLNERVSTVKPTEKYISPILIRLIRDGEYKEIDEELSKGADVNYDYSNGWRPLHYASRESNTDIIDLLVEHGADIDSQIPNTGDTPLILACKTIQLNSIRELIKLGADKKIKNKLGNTAYEVLIQYTGHKEGMDVTDILNILKP